MRYIPRLVRVAVPLLILAATFGYAYRSDQAIYEKEHCGFARENGFPAPECKP